jgi:hypothetical protein
MPAFIQDLFDLTKNFLFDNWYFFLPLFLILVFWDIWINYIRTKFIYNLNWIILEVKLPREITKSPRAMEIALNMFHQTSDGNFWEKYWVGKLRPWFSLEIVGIGGEIHFFIYTQSFFRNLIESQIYAQYPEVEIVEAEDYSKRAFIDGFGTDWGCFGTEFELTAEDAYPIRTYVDYGLHETLTKEEQKNDPMTSFLELLGSLKEGENIWFQILIRATKKEWKDEGKALIDKITERGKKLGEGEQAKRLTSGESEIIKAIEKDVSKLGFDVGIRALYLARQDRFNAINIPSMIGSMKQYNAVNLNGFKPTRTTSLDYWWQLKAWREQRMKIRMMDAYRKRSYFYTPYPRKPFVLNTEELATIFHFPGRVAETPTFGRIEAKKGEPPAGLPI